MRYCCTQSILKIYNIQENDDLKMSVEGDEKLLENKPLQRPL